MNKQVAKKGNFKKFSLEYIANFSYLRWTLDEEKDLEVIREIFNKIDPKASWQEILALVMKRPFIQMRNQIINTNEGSDHYGDDINKRYKIRYNRLHSN